MDQPRFKVIVTRVNQPAHQMAEVSMTLPGYMLGHMIRAFIDTREKWGPGLTEDGSGHSIDAGTWKSVTISRLDDEPDL